MQTIATRWHGPWAPSLRHRFVPLTSGWLDAIAGRAGIMRPGGKGVLGPLGLTAAFRLVVSGRPPRNQWLRTALVAGPVAYGLLTLVIRLTLGGTGALAFAAADSFDFRSGIVLLSALPALGAVHLLRLAPPSPH